MLALSSLFSTLALSSLFGTAAAFEAAALSASAQRRTATPLMKGKGSRGMPGKAVRPPATGMQKNVKSRLEKRDFMRDEWTLVASADELGSAFGDTLAVEAGQSPQGTNFIWTLIRGDDGVGEGSTVYATDGSCRACTYPMVRATTSKTSDGVSINCPACGSSFNLENGDVIEWLPAKGPAQWAAAQLNKDKEPMNAGILQARVSKAGRIYVRLPDGTLKITKTAAERASDLARGGSFLS